MSATAAILLVGDELVRGERLDTNGQWVARRLFRRGHTVVRIATCGDDRSRIATEFNRACAEASLVIVTGGLGPTEDDLTRFGIAEALGVELVEHPAAIEQVRARLAARGRPFVDRQRLQALVPAGAQVILNPAGIAPGFWGQHPAGLYIALVGVPAEIDAMWTASVETLLDRHGPRPERTPFVVLHLFGLPEVSVQERIIACFGPEEARRIGICASAWVISVYLLGAPARQADRARAALAPHVFGADDDSLESVVVDVLKRRRLRLAVAESLTGGGIGEAVTAVPGSSAVFAGGAVVYTDEAKRRLGVSPATLAADGAVSEACALELAQQARRWADADVGVSATGFAGPDGGTTACPVGTVFLAVDTASGARARRIAVRGPRGHVRRVAVNYALALVLCSLGFDLLAP